MAKIRCPTCGKLFDPEQTVVMPFCCERCQQIDLHRWLNEQYGMPVENEQEQDGEPPDEDSKY